MNKYFICEQTSLVKFLSRGEVSREDVQAGWIEDLEREAASWTDILEVNEDGAVITISGVLVNYNPTWVDAYFGQRVCNYEDIINSIDEVIDRKIENVTVIFDTPGGYLAGCEKTREYLEMLSSEVNVTPVNAGMCDSGGIWLCSGIGVPVMGDATAEIGSIGVKVTYFDNERMLDENGIDRTILTNTVSTEKVPDVRTDSGAKVVIDELDALYDIFASNVSKGFGIDREKIDALKGRCLIGSNAVEYGLMRSGASDATSKSGNAQIKTSEAKVSQGGTKRMKLSEAYAEHPELEAEVTALVESSAETAKATGKKIANYLESGSYDCVKGHMVSVLNGTMSIEALEGGIMAIDAQRAEAKTKAAAEETEVIGDTPATPAIGATGKDPDAKVDFSKPLDSIEEIKKRQSALGGE